MIKNFLRSPARLLIHGMRSLKQNLEEYGVRRVISDYPATEPDVAELRFYSQWGEDRFLRRIFGAKTTGVALEVGGFDGVNLSNTFHFEEQGCKTIIVEPMPAFAQKIRSRRKAELYECAAGAQEGEAVLNIAKGAEELSTFSPSGYQLENIKFHGAILEQVTVAVRTLDSILASAGVTKLDFATVDVEGHETEALTGFALSRWKPEIVIVEDASMGTNSAVKDLMEAQGYLRFMTTGCNDWYASSENRRLVHRDSQIRDRMRTLICKALALRDRITQPRQAG